MILGQTLTASVAPANRRGIICSRLMSPTGAVIANAGTNGAGTATQIYEQTHFIATEDARDISIVYGNLDGSGTGSQAMTVKASIFKGADYSPTYTPLTTPFPIYWPGSVRTSASIPVGSILESLTVDPRFTLTAGDAFTVRRLLTFASVPTNWPATEVNVFRGDEVRTFGTALTDSIDNADAAGLIYTRDGTAQYAYAPPWLINGRAPGLRKAKVLILADSITAAGSGDDGTIDNMGWLCRALGNDYANVRVGKSGYTLNSLLTTSGHLANWLDQAIRVSGCDVVVNALITNDLGAGRTTAQYMADLATLKANLTSYGVRKMIQCTSTPRTNAANNAKFGTDGAGVQAERLLLNAAIRSASGVGDGIIDLAQYTENSGSTNLWSNTSSRGSGDGIHPNQTTHTYVGSQVSSLLPALLA